MEVLQWFWQQKGVTLSDELAMQLLPAARAIVEPLRQYGAYAPALPARAEDGSSAELLRYLGRDPEWVA